MQEGGQASRVAPYTLTRQAGGFWHSPIVFHVGGASHSQPTRRPAASAQRIHSSCRPFSKITAAHLTARRQRIHFYLPVSLADEIERRPRRGQDLRSDAD